MRAQSAPAVEDERAALRTVQAHVVEEHMVAPEGLTQSTDEVAGEVLLPVKPPEVDALLLALTNDVAKHGAIEGRVFQLPGHAVGAHGHAHVGAHLIEVVLMSAHAVGGMQVQRHLQALLVHPAYESVRVGYELLVPCPARPAIEMPVHVENHHVEGDVVLPNLVGQVDEVLL